MTWQILSIRCQDDDSEVEFMEFLQGPVNRQYMPRTLNLFVEDVLAFDPLWHAGVYMTYNVRMRNNDTGRSRLYPFVVVRYSPDPNVDFVHIRLMGPGY